MEGIVFGRSPPPLGGKRMSIHAERYAHSEERLRRDIRQELIGSGADETTPAFARAVDQFIHVLRKEDRCLQADG